MPRVYTRKFDWDEALRLRNAGLTYTTIAAQLGVSSQAVYLALNQDARERNRRTANAWQSSGTCPNCGKPATRHGKNIQNRCRECANKMLATSVRADELLCFLCRKWKSDEDFPYHRGAKKLRRGRHSYCRACNTIARRSHRERNPEHQRAYDRKYSKRRRALLKSEEAPG